MQPAIEPAANIPANVLVDVPVDFDDDPELVEFEHTWFQPSDEEVREAAELAEWKAEWEAQHPAIVPAIVPDEPVIDRTTLITDLTAEQQHNLLLQAVQQWVDDADDEYDDEELDASTNSGQCEMPHQC
jgi:hypothetical protein